jgi:hypothetical protein
MWIVIQIQQGAYMLEVAERRLPFGVFQRGRELYWNLMRHGSLSVQADPNFGRLAGQYIRSGSFVGLSEPNWRNIPNSQ